MFDCKVEIEKRVRFIKQILSESGANGIVFGNSGGKDSALVGILSKMAAENVIGVIMPCGSKINYGSDMDDAKELAKQFGIETVVVDLTETKETLLSHIGDVNRDADINIAPRLRMTTLYAIAADRSYLVAGTGNMLEQYIGYFTKYGDGGCDFNPIADLTVSQVYELLAYLSAPDMIISKAPSAGLFEGQTDEDDLGITYKEIEDYIINGVGDAETIEKIECMHQRSEHKRKLPETFSEKVSSKT